MKLSNRIERIASAAAVVALLFASQAGAQIVAATSRGVVVAHDGRVELFDRTGSRRIWSSEAPGNASQIVTASDRIAVLDGFDNEVTLVDLATGHTKSIAAGETPVGGVFIDKTLFILERDARALERIGADGARASVSLAADPAFIRTAGGSIYVYSRVGGVVQEISPTTMTVKRKLDIAPFASDFETDGRTGYLVLPRQAKLKTFSLATMRATGDLPAGVVPVDLAVTRKGNALSAATLSIADPSARRVWIAEGSQSLTAAVARGFVRGLLGLGLFAPRNSDFPSGVDRILASNSTAVAYDSASRTLYKLRGSKGKVLARDVEPGAFTATSEGVFVWENGRFQLIR